MKDNCKLVLRSESKKLDGIISAYLVEDKENAEDSELELVISDSSDKHLFDVVKFRLSKEDLKLTLKRGNLLECLELIYLNSEVERKNTFILYVN
jgi:hypothetical protein